MDSKVKLIYCADGNARFAKIAHDSGFLYGAQLPRKIYYPIYMADQNWKKPYRPGYMNAVARESPYMATVLDLERHDQFDEVMSWAQEISDFVSVIIVIPKVSGVISSIPRYINNKPVRLGYSVPTKYGKTDLSTSEFYGWDVHLLGGNPHKQMEYFDLLNVVSIDINYHAMKARRFCEFWRNKQWIALSEAGDFERKDAIYRAFELSCNNIIDAWDKKLGGL